MENDRNYAPGLLAALALVSAMASMSALGDGSLQDELDALQQHGLRGKNSIGNTSHSAHSMSSTLNALGWLNADENGRPVWNGPNWTR